MGWITPNCAAALSRSLRGCGVGEETDCKRVEKYAVRMGNGAILKRLGYLLDLFDLGPPNLHEHLQRKLTTGYAVLDPLSPCQGSHNAHWRLLVNVDREPLTRWRET